MIKIVEIKNKFVYPIFKNGRSSIVSYAKQHKSRWLINEQCNRAQCITIFIRNPKERFISGVHSFIEFEKRKNPSLHYDTMLYAIQNYKVTNAHFETQMSWITYLSKFYEGDIDCLGVSDLYKLIPNRDKPKIPNITQIQKNKIAKIKFDDIRQDEILYNKYIGKKLPINTLTEEIKHAMSSP